MGICPSSRRYMNYGKSMISLLHYLFYGYRTCCQPKIPSFYENHALFFRVEDVDGSAGAAAIPGVVQWGNDGWRNLTPIYRPKIDRRIIDGFARFFCVRYNNRGRLDVTNRLFGRVCICAIIANPSHFADDVFKTFGVIVHTEVVCLAWRIIFSGAFNHQLDAVFCEIFV